MNAADIVEYKFKILHELSAAFTKLNEDKLKDQDGNKN